MSRTQYEAVSVSAPECIDDEAQQLRLCKLKTQERAFLLLGLLNNVSYVIMLACAKDISEGGTALVYVANIVPSLTIQASGPYWFDKVSYPMRITIAACFMAAAFLMVAGFSWMPLDPAQNKGLSTRTIGQLVGVALISLQTGLGEASLLALAGKYDAHRAAARNNVSNEVPLADNLPTLIARGDQEVDSSEPVTSDDNLHSCKAQANCITQFSSGTGLAGPCGFLWKITFEWLGIGLSATLLAALTLALLYALVYHRYFASDPIILQAIAIDISPTLADTEKTNRGSDEIVPDTGSSNPIHCDQPLQSVASSSNSCAKRFQQALSLWPYTVPLFTVYVAEYACQAGAWSAIGFPTDSIQARNSFYLTSNWLYQAGVFVSRSSGTLFSISLFVLWALPGMQIVNLIFFSYTAGPQYSEWLHNPVVYYILAFYTGLIGGTVYVHGYKRILIDRPHDTEFVSQFIVYLANKVT
jgi:battenin